MFFYGEDSVTDNLSPYIDAAPKEEQKYFLATQQVDEARHAVFFHRFFKEVIGAGDSISSTLAYTEAELSWGYRNVFDRLDRMADDLRRDRSLPNFARAIAMYHMVVEATLAQPGQHYIEDYFADAGTMPGFSEGMANVSRDEQRHIGFGVKVLAECFAESEECKQAVAELLREVLPYTLAVFYPVDRAREYTRAYGFELEDLFAFGLRSVRTKWRAAGYPIDDMPGVFPVDPEWEPEEVARRQIVLLEAGVMGPPNGRPESSAEVQRLHFDLIANAARTERINGDPMTIQWQFSDADPWHVRIDNGSTAAEPGLAPSPDLTIESELAGLGRDVDQGRRRPQARAAPADPPARLAAQPAAAGEGLPAAPVTARLSPDLKRRSGRPRPPPGLGSRAATPTRARRARLGGRRERRRRASAPAVG